MIPIRRPGTSTEIRGKWRSDKGTGNGGFKHKIVDLVLRGRIRGRGAKTEDLDSSIIASSSKVFIRRVEGDAFDMALVV